MATPPSSVRARRQGPTVTFQVEGWGRMTHSLPVRRFAEEALDAGATSLRVDLRRCTHVDSTFLGTLLWLKRTVEQRGQGDFVLLSPSEQCRRALRQLAVEGLFAVRAEEEPEAADWVELSGDTDDAAGFAQNVVHAHQELANLEGPAGAPFREVVRTLAQELSEGRGRDS